MNGQILGFKNKLVTCDEKDIPVIRGQIISFINLIKFVKNKNKKLSR